MRNLIMEDWHVYIFVIVGLVVAVYLIVTVSPTTAVLGETDSLSVYNVPQLPSEESSVVENTIGIEEVPEANFSSNL